MSNQMEPNTLIELLMLGIPGTFEYYDNLEIAIGDVLTGKATPKDAMDKVYDEWKAITERKGLESQRAAYRAFVKLPPL